MISSSFAIFKNKYKKSRIFTSELPGGFENTKNECRTPNESIKTKFIRFEVVLLFLMI
jgi:hypothetical protein